MKNQIYPCLWFDGKAKDAAELYCSIFKNSKIITDTPMVVNFEIEGQKIMVLNGGPEFTINPSISFFVTCEDDKEIEYLWKALSKDGSVLMELNTYPWSEKYGWCADKFGMTWQIFKGKLSDVKQKIVPLFLFSHHQYGNAESAIKFYTSIFKNSNIENILHYGKDDAQAEGKVMHAQFRLQEKVFMAMDGPGDHTFDFNEAVSFVIPCDTQEEIDYYWNALTKGGQESMCGWLKDKFGVSWQVVPTILSELMSDPKRAPKVVQAFLQMKKFDIEKLKQE